MTERTGDQLLVRQPENYGCRYFPFCTETRQFDQSFKGVIPTTVGIIISRCILSRFYSLAPVSCDWCEGVGVSGVLTNMNIMEDFQTEAIEWNGFLLLVLMEMFI